MGKISNCIKDGEVMYLEEGEYYNADGDRIDKRNEIIKQLRSELTYYRARDQKERMLREKNEGLQELYGRYQTMLGLVDNA